MTTTTSFLDSSHYIHSYVVFSQCIKSIPTYGLGPLKALKDLKDLKPHEVLNRCFSVRIQTRNAFLDFKVIKQHGIDNHSLAKRFIPSLMYIFNQIEPMESKILEYLDEYTLLAKASCLSKAWMLRIFDYSNKWQDRLKSLSSVSRNYFRYGNNNYVVRIQHSTTKRTFWEKLFNCNVSRIKKYSVRVCREDSLLDYGFSYPIQLPPNRRLIHFLQDDEITKIIVQFELDEEHRWQSLEDTLA